MDIIFKLIAWSAQWVFGYPSPAPDVGSVRLGPLPRPHFRSGGVQIRIGNHNGRGYIQYRVQNPLEPTRRNNKLDCILHISSINGDLYDLPYTPH